MTGLGSLPAAPLPVHPVQHSPARRDGRRKKSCFPPDDGMVAQGTYVCRDRDCSAADALQRPGLAQPHAEQACMDGRPPRHGSAG